MHHFKEVLIKHDTFEDCMLDSQRNSLSWESIIVFADENNPSYNPNATLNG